MAKPADIRLDLGFFRSLKTRKLLAVLGPEGVLALLRLWLYAAEFHQDGVLEGLDDEDFEAICEWSCEAHAERIRPALVRLGWVDPDGVTLHDWETHQGWIVGAPARSRAASIAAKAKHRKRVMRGAGKPHAGRKRAACASAAPLPSDPDPDPDPKGGRVGGDSTTALSGTGRVESPRYENLPKRLRVLIRDEAVSRGTSGSVDAVTEEWFRSGKIHAEREGVSE